MFCPNCGKEITDGSAFCPGCGKATAAAPAAPVTAAAPAASATPVGKKLHCPNCKSSNIQISTESSVTGAVTANGRHFSSTHVTNEHQNFWFCSDCGTKFRNIQNLEAEIQKKKSYPVVYGVFTLIFLVLTIVLLIQAVSSFFGFLFYSSTFLFAILTIVFFCQIFSWKKKLAALRAELEYLQVNCFN